MYRGLKPVKHEMHVCSTCHDETEQFFTDVKYREGFEVKKTWQGFVTTKEEELLKNVDGFWYICENCGGMNLVDKFCRKCGAEMQVGKLSCSKCGAEFKELGSRKGYKRETPDRLQEKNNAAKTSQEVRTHSDQPTITIRQPVIKVRRKTPTLILLTVICVVPLLGLAYSLFTPFIPITIYQTMTFNTASSVTRTFTFSIANPTSYTSLFCALICATTVRVLSYVPTTSTVAYTAFSSSSSTSYGFSTQSPYALSQGGSIVLMTVTIILVGAALFYFGRTRQISHDVIPPSQLSNQATEPTKDTVKPTVKFCRECGAKMPRDSRFCEKCGQNVQPI
jgi:ribosomal protein L40E